MTMSAPMTYDMAPAMTMAVAPPVMMAAPAMAYEMAPAMTMAAPMAYDMAPAMTMAAPAMTAAPMTMAGGYGGGMGMSAVPTTYGSAPTMGGGGLFNLVDTNQDGGISRSEFMRAFG